jgi:exopolyphosphatase / guanosine-5'-triphosphate,3'-diphosphate pyrophosphatase
MSAERRAVIDVGTNSVKLLVGEVSPDGVRPLVEQSHQTRLGSGFYATHRLSHTAIQSTARAIAAFAAESARWGAQSPRVIGTSAARDAANPDELQAAIRAACGLDLELISGEKEADWAFLGVASDPALGGAALLIVDAGGGSTEVIAGEGLHVRVRESFRLGTVRLLERLKIADPPTAADWAHCQRAIRETFERDIVPVVCPALVPLGRDRVRVVGTSGTTSILARIDQGLEEFDRDRIDATTLTRGAVERQRERLWSLSLAERKRIVGLPEDRADVILTGVAIYEAVLEQLGFAELRVSTRGLRFGALMQPGRI